MIDRSRCLRRIAVSGLAGGLAMIPVGLVLRFMFGQSVNVYGELIVIRVAGHLDPTLLAIEHGALSVAMAAPLVIALDHLGHGTAPAIGLVYGGTSWLVVNSLALPWIFDQPTPWQVGSQAIWGSLIVHLTFGLVVALVSQRVARGGVLRFGRSAARADRV